MKQILLIEDNPADVGLMREAMREAGLEVVLHAAENAPQAFMFLRNKLAIDLPDVIILDLRMPVIDGLATLKILKANAPIDAIPVVILTSSRTTLDRTTCLRAGAACFTSKPMTIDGYVGLANALAQRLRSGFAACPSDD